MIVSGIVLYIMPHGRVAYFTGWRFLGLDKDQWGNLHIIFGILISIGAIWHIYLNWKVMKKYLLRKESAIALGISLVIGIGTVANLPPFSWVAEVEEVIKNSWPENKMKPPIPHAELMPLKKLCKKVGIPVPLAVATLKKHNLKFSPEMTLGEIGKENGMTPAEVWELLKPLQPSKPEGRGGQRGGE